MPVINILKYSCLLKFDLTNQASGTEPAAAAKKCNIAAVKTI